MKGLVSTVFLLTVAAAASADDIKTIDGSEYKGVTISRTEPDGLIVITDSGIEKIPFARLDKATQEKYHYDPAKAAAFGSAVTAAARQRYADTQTSAAAALDIAVRSTAQNQARSAVEKTADSAHFTISQVTKEGALGHVSFYRQRRVMEQHGATSVPTLETYLTPESEELVFVYGLKGIDGQACDIILYATSPFKYTSVIGAGKTVAAFATTAEKALQHSE